MVSAMRTLAEIEAHIGAGEFFFDAAESARGWRADLYNLAVVIHIGERAFACERYLVAFFSSGEFVSVNVIQQDALDCLLPEARGAVRSDDVYDAAGI